MVFLVSDILFYFLIAALVAAVFWMRKQPQLSESWGYVFRTPSGMSSALVILFFLFFALLDSVHFHSQPGQSAKPVISLLDKALSPRDHQYEKTYSAPLAFQLFSKETITKPDGSKMRLYPHVKFAAQGVESIQQRNHDVLVKWGQGLGYSFLLGLCFLIFFIGIYAWMGEKSAKANVQDWWQGQTTVAWRTACLTCCVMAFLLLPCFYLSHFYHVLGTDKIGGDVFYETLKSIRTGVLIGTLTTLFMLPLALCLGSAAGYYGGRIDDAIQYLYTTLSSIPGVLLISASVLALQVFIYNHQSLFPTLSSRADARLLILCIILGVTSWTGLCRLLRAETLKIRQLEYVQAAQSLGVSHQKIIWRHIIPNVMHIVMITIVIDFSGLVLAEAVLSYVGVGVDPTMMSWGHMINSARLELARSPMVWWPLMAALIAMFALVLSANIFSDAVRDAFDPRIH